MARHHQRRLGCIAAHVTSATSAPDDFAPAQLLRRVVALGATDAQLDGAVAAPDTGAALRELAHSLSPPPSGGVAIEDLAVGPTASVEAIVQRLDRYGACVIRSLASDALMDRVDEECTSAGAWDAADLRATGSNQTTNRMGIEVLMKAPSVADLLTHPLVLAAVNTLLCRSSKRVALKELEVFELQPGQGAEAPRWHREDQNWPWHHQPWPWAVDVLWAVTPFTLENGGTVSAAAPFASSAEAQRKRLHQALIPYSHRWLRQATRTDRGMEGHATPWEAASGRAQYAVPEEQAVRCSMPRGSVLLFSGGVLHSAGKNNASTGRRTVLSGYQLGWLRPENNFWGDKALRDAVYNGGPAPFDKTMLELLGHWDPETVRPTNFVAQTNRFACSKRLHRHSSRRRAACTSRCATSGGRRSRCWRTLATRTRAAAAATKSSADCS